LFGFNQANLILFHSIFSFGLLFVLEKGKLNHSKGKEQKGKERNVFNILINNKKRATKKQLMCV